MLGLSASSGSMENAAFAARVNQTALTMAQHTSFAGQQNSSIDYYLPPCVAQTLRQQVCGAMVVAHDVYFYVGADLCDAGLSQGAVAQRQSTIRTCIISRQPLAYAQKASSFCQNACNTRLSRNSTATCLLFWDSAATCASRCYLPSPYYGKAL